MAASNNYPVLKFKPFKAKRRVIVFSTLFLLIFSSLVSPLVQFGIFDSKPIERLFNVMAQDPQPEDSQPQTDKEITITREVCGISGSVEVTFAWKKIDGASKYNLEIARLTDFDPSSTLTAITSSLEHTVTLEANIRFRLRVVGEGEKGEAKSSLAATYYNTACAQSTETNRLAAYSKTLSENIVSNGDGAVAGEKLIAQSSLMTCKMNPDTTFNLNIGSSAVTQNFSVTATNIDQGELYVGATYINGTVRFFRQQPNAELSLSSNARIRSDSDQGFYNSPGVGGTKTFNFTISLDANHAAQQNAYTLSAFYIQTVVSGQQVGSNKQCNGASSGLGGMVINTYATVTPTPTFTPIPTPTNIPTPTPTSTPTQIPTPTNTPSNMSCTISPDNIFNITVGASAVTQNFSVTATNLDQGELYVGATYVDGTVRFFKQLPNFELPLSAQAKIRSGAEQGYYNSTGSGGSKTFDFAIDLSANHAAQSAAYTLGAFYVQTVKNGLQVGENKQCNGLLSNTGGLVINTISGPTPTRIPTPTPTTAVNTPTPTGIVSNMTCVMSPASGVMSIQSLYGQQAQQAFTLTGNSLDRGELYIGVTYEDGTVKFFKNEVGNTVVLSEAADFSAYIRSDDTGYYNSPGGGSKIFKFTVILSPNHPGGTPVYRLPAIYIQTTQRNVAGELEQLGKNKNCTLGGVVINVFEAPTPTPTTGPLTPTPTTTVSTPTPTPPTGGLLACSLNITATEFARGSAASSFGDLSLSGGTSGSTYYVGMIYGVNYTLFVSQPNGKIEIGDKEFNPIQIYPQKTTLTGVSGSSLVLVDPSNTVLSGNYGFELGVFDQSLTLLKKCGKPVDLKITDGGSTPTPLGKVTLETCNTGKVDAVLDWALWAMTTGYTPTKYVWEYNLGTSLVGAAISEYKTGESFARTAGVTGLFSETDYAWKVTAYNGSNLLATSPIFTHQTRYCEAVHIPTPTPTNVPTGLPTTTQTPVPTSTPTPGALTTNLIANASYSGSNYPFNNVYITGGCVNQGYPNYRTAGVEFRWGNNTSNPTSTIYQLKWDFNGQTYYYPEDHYATPGENQEGRAVVVGWVPTTTYTIQLSARPGDYYDAGADRISFSTTFSFRTATCAGAEATPTNTPPTVTPTRTPTNVPTVTPTNTPIPTATPTTAPTMACSINPRTLALKTGETLSFIVSASNLDQGDLYVGAYYVGDSDGHFFSPNASGNGVLALSDAARIRSTDGNLGYIQSGGGGTRQFNFRIEADAYGPVGNYTLREFFIQTVQNGTFIRNTSCVGGGSLVISVSAGLAATPTPTIVPTATPTLKPGTPTNTPVPTVVTSPTPTPIPGSFNPVINILSAKCSPIDNAEILINWGEVSGIAGYGVELAISSFSPSDFSYYRYPSDWSDLAKLYKITTISDYEFVSNTIYQARITAIKSDGSQYPSVVKTVNTGDCAKMSADVGGLNGSETNKLIPVQVSGDVVENAFAAVARYNNGWNRPVQIEVRVAGEIYQPVTAAGQEIQIGTGVFVRAKASGTLNPPFDRNSSSFRGISYRAVYFDAYATSDAQVESDHPIFAIRIRDGSTYYEGASFAVAIPTPKETTYDNTKESGFNFIKSLAGLNKGGGCRGSSCWEVNYSPSRAKLLVGMWGTESGWSTVGTSGCDKYGCHSGSMYSFGISDWSRWAGATGLYDGSLSNGGRGDFVTETKVVDTMFTRSFNDPVTSSYKYAPTYFGPWNIGDENFTYGGNWCTHPSNGYRAAYNTGLLNDLGPNCYD